VHAPYFLAKNIFVCLIKAIVFNWYIGVKQRPKAAVQVVAGVAADNLFKRKWRANNRSGELGGG